MFRPVLNCLGVLAGFSLLVGFVGGQPNTIGNYLQNTGNFSYFLEALDKTGYTIKLRTNGRRYTVFAPNNTAIEQSIDFQTYLNIDLWREHLKLVVQTHIISGTIFSYGEIFDGERSVIQTEGNQEVNITQGLNKVNDVQILNNGIVLSNGIIYPIDEAIRAEFEKHNILTSIPLQKELVPRWLEIIDLAEFYEPIDEFNRQTGNTFLAPRNQAINGAFRYEDEAIVAEYQNASTTNRTYGYLEFNLIDMFIDRNKFDKSSSLLVYPRNDVAHMWITKDATGTFRFNDAEIIREYDVANGKVYIIETVLVPPGISELVQYTGMYTSIDVTDSSGYMSGTLWNPRDLAVDITWTNSSTFTWFCPIEDAYKLMNRDDILRLATPMWIRHVRDFIGFMMISPAKTYDELYNETLTAGGEMEIEMVNMEGTNKLSINEEDKLMLNGAEFFQSDFKGVDGYFHVTTDLPRAKSVRMTINDRIKDDPKFSYLSTWIETNLMGRYIDNLSPLTYFAVPNEYQLLSIPILEIPDLLRNHAVRGLIYLDELKAGKHKTLTSENGATWTIDVFNDTVYIDYDNPFCNITLEEGHLTQDILARTGVMQTATGLMVKKYYPRATLSPTLPPVQSFGEGGGQGSQGIGLPPVTTQTNGADAPASAPAPAPSPDSSSSMIMDSMLSATAPLFVMGAYLLLLWN